MTEPTAGTYSAAAGEKIRRARERAKLSLTDAAEKSGRFSAPALRSWEAGDRGITLRRLKQIADLLGVPPASLLPAEPADDPLVFTEEMVDVIIAIGDAFRASRRSRHAILAEDRGGTS